MSVCFAAVVYWSDPDGNVRRYEYRASSVERTDDGALVVVTAAGYVECFAPGVWVRYSFEMQS